MHKYVLFGILISIPFSSMQDSIEKISDNTPWIFSRPNNSHYFPTLLILISKLKITTVTETALWDNLKTLNYLCNSTYCLTYTTQSMTQVARNKPEYTKQLKLLWSNNLQEESATDGVQLKST